MSIFVTKEDIEKPEVVSSLAEEGGVWHYVAQW